MAEIHYVWRLFSKRRGRGSGRVNDYQNDRANLDVEKLTFTIRDQTEERKDTKFTPKKDCKWINKDSPPILKHNVPTYPTSFIFVCCFFLTFPFWSWCPKLSFNSIKMWRGLWNELLYGSWWRKRGNWAFALSSFFSFFFFFFAAYLCIWFQVRLVVFLRLLLYTPAFCLEPSVFPS